MSKQDSIRIRNRDRELIQQLNKKVSSKKSRLRKKGIDLDVPTIGVTQFTTRKEFNAYVKQMESFTNPYNMGAQYVKTKQGVVFTKKELNTLEREINLINRLKDKKRKEIEHAKFRHRGIEMPMSIKERISFMKDKNFRSLRHIVFNPEQFKKKEDLVHQLNQLKENYSGKAMRQKDTIYKENYLSAIENVHGVDSELYKVVSRMSLKKFMQFYYTENLANIKYVYEKLLRQEMHDALVEIYKGEY